MTKFYKGRAAGQTPYPYYKKKHVFARIFVTNVAPWVKDVCVAVVGVRGGVGWGGVGWGGVGWGGVGWGGVGWGGVGWGGVGWDGVGWGGVGWGGAGAIAPFDPSPWIQWYMQLEAHIRRRNPVGGSSIYFQ